MSFVPPAITVFFSVTVDTVPLGNWTKMSGLGMQIATVDRSDTAMTFFQHHLPGAITYNDIVLERQVSADTSLSMNWFSTYHMVPIPVTAQIVCLDGQHQPIYMWELLGVTPRAWKGPSFDAGGPAVSTETLTISHMGFV
jgi:phage tail-like protein